MKLRCTKTTSTLGLIVFLSLLSGCTKGSTAARTDVCYKSFDEFAYVVPEDEVFQQKFAPLAPWQLEADLPGSFLTFSHMEAVAAVRPRDSYSEIWVSRYYWEGLDDDTAFTEFLIYRTDTKEWKTISAEVEGTGVFVDRLFVTKDGTLWGKNGGRSTSDRSPIVAGTPILSEFDQGTEGFEFVEATREIPVGWSEGEYGNANWAEVLVNGDEMIWVFSENDGIHSFDPVTRTSKYHREFPHLSISSITYAPDGTFYLLLYDPDNMQNSMSPYFEDDTLFQYVPATEEIKPVAMPRTRWYGFWEILADREGRLWLDAEGYRESGGKWHELRPASFEYYWKWVQETAWRWSADPYVRMQSSDGRIWFSIDHPDVRGYKSGMAWLDPETEQGCWFTSVGSNIVEDNEKNLWLVVDEKLYRYSLEP